MQSATDDPIPPQLPDPAPGPTQEVLARLAELLWEHAGRPAGREREFRRRAEANLSAAEGAARDEQ